jgi:hypothetical protein
MMLVYVIQSSNNLGVSYMAMEAVNSCNFYHVITGTFHDWTFFKEAVTGKKYKFGIKKTRNKLRGLSPRANYTDPATAALSAKLVPTFADRGELRSQYSGSPTAGISVLWTGAATFSFK